MLFRGQILGKYKIVSTLGSGGFGAVYLARDTWIDKDVAIKVPHKQNLNFGELLREPRLLATLNHPNIVAITTAEKEENLFFIVMEYVKGHTLEDVIDGEGPLDTPKVLDYAAQVCEAVRHAHDQGIIHRDLRPPNILVSESGVLKVADFGTSRFLEMASRGNTVIGSPSYMAPEQFRGKAVFASDIYSLGITIYQMLTGQLPYDTPVPSNLDLLMKGDLVKPPRLRNPSIPTSLNDIVMKAVAPDLSNRYQNTEDLLTDLKNAQKKRRRITEGEGLVDPSTTMLSDRVKSRYEPHAPPRTPEATTGPFCWHCHKPLHARADRCPFCREIQ